jgi:hypothetical protein
VAEYFLEQLGFEVYLPRVRHYWIRYNRRIEHLAPLFPGYCFTRIELQWIACASAPAQSACSEARGTTNLHMCRTR